MGTLLRNRSRSKKAECFPGNLRSVRPISLRANFCPSQNRPKRKRTRTFRSPPRILRTQPNHSVMRRLHPRSPYEKLGGYVHLPRLIDKARLHRKGLLNGYNYKTVGFDKHLPAFLKLDGNAFEDVANSLDDDGAFLARIQDNGTRRPP